MMAISLWTTLFLSVALAMDCLAVSITIGLKERTYRWETAIRVALAFGIFQGMMPVIGYVATSMVYDYLVAYGPWISFAMLSFIGVKMIIEAWKEGGEENEEKGSGLEGTSFDVSKIGILIYLAVATSIDALAVGVSYGAMGVSVYVPSVIIGLVSAMFAMAGVGIGSALGNIFGNKAEMSGGIVLCGLGLKILLEHLIG